MTPTNLIIAGLGGQGVLKASDILADAAFRNGFDVKKSELHGMSQRGGSLSSDVRFGERILSPMIPHGEAGFLLALQTDQAELYTGRLAPDAVVITARAIEEVRLPHPKCGNVVLLGALSCHLPFEPDAWADAIRAAFPQPIHATNLEAFELGRRLGD